MKTERFDFTNPGGHTLTALLQLPPGPEPSSYALFAHCFTCSKDSRAARWISDALAARGIAVLRFDFTGLGSSEGEFANTDFSSNVEDLVAAADHLRATRQAPALLIGHSLGGAAVLAAAARIPESRAVATIGAPSDPSHVTNLFAEQIGAIRERGDAQVCIGGREFRIRRDFLDDVAEQRLADQVATMRRALLILHSPTDEVVSIDNASALFLAARHPKSFVSLDGADHLIARRSEAGYVGDVIGTWSQRYLPAPEDFPGHQQAPGAVLVSETGRGAFEQSVTMGRHHLVADEPVDVGGMDSGPSPYDLLLAGLGACTSMTLRMYAERKKLPLEHVSVLLRHSKVHATDCANCETTQGQIDRVERTITLAGDLDETTRTRLLEIADKCPVHRTLTSEVEIRTALAEPSDPPDPLSGSAAPPD